MKIKKYIPTAVLSAFMFGIAYNKVFAQSFFQNTFRNITTNTNAVGAFDVLDLLESIAGFLIIAGGIIAGIALVVAGIMWMSAGSNTARLASAKSWFKNGVIGALIVFAFGVIINTIVNFATDPQGFFF